MTGTTRDVVGEKDVVLSELLCSYDCYDQTYTSDKPLLFELPNAQQKNEACRQAIYCLPILVPPDSVPIGYSWHVRVGNDYMNFRMEAEQEVGGSVLVIRREGRFTTQPSPHSSNGYPSTSVLVERQGITLFAWNRGIVLEDRFQDCIIEASTPSSSQVGAITQEITRLLRSCPTEET